MRVELFAQRAGGLKMQHVPCRGMGPALTGLAAGTVQMIFTTVGKRNADILRPLPGDAAFAALCADGVVQGEMAQKGRGGRDGRALTER